MQRFSAVLALLVAVPIMAAQSTSSSTGITSPGQGMSTQSGSSSQERNAADDISAIAPPFDVDDVLRMHRVGLQDVVIINALRSRYHPLKLSDSDRALLVKNSVDAAVIAAMENPLGEDTAGHAAPPTVQVSPEPDPAKAATDKPASDAKAATPDITVAATVVRLAGASSATPVPISSATTAAESAPLGIRSLPPNRQDSSKVESLSDVDTLKTPGVYRRINGAGWGTVPAEAVAWKHDEEYPVKRAEGHLPGATSPTTTPSANSDFLIVTPEGVSVVQYQLVRISSKHTGREFHAALGGDAFGGGGNSEAVAYNPQKLGATVWLVSLHGLPRGDYGFLPPVRGELHSTTGFAKAIYTFRVL